MEREVQGGYLVLVILALPRLEDTELKYKSLRRGDSGYRLQQKLGRFPVF